MTDSGRHSPRDRGAPALDPDVLESLRALNTPGQPDVLGDLVRLFLKDAPERLEVLERGLREGDVGGVERAAHALKGASGSIGAPGLARLCAEMTEDARRGTLAGGAERLAAIRAEWERVRAALLRIISSDQAD